MGVFNFFKVQLQQYDSLSADTAAGVSVVAAGFAWFTEANEIIQLIAGCVAIVAGVTAVWWHTEKALETRAKRHAQDR